LFSLELSLLSFLIKKADVPEGKGYGGFPSAQPDVNAKHQAKVYGGQ
jgi:malate dehydrogenase (quinone)